MASTKISEIADSIMGPFATLMLKQAHFPPPEDFPLKVLDNACGPGTVTLRILSSLSSHDKAKLELSCADISELMIGSLSQKIESGSWKNVKAFVADAMVFITFWSFPSVSAHPITNHRAPTNLVW